MTAAEWFWLAFLAVLAVADTVLWLTVGARATLTHLIRRMFCFDADGRQRRLWRARRALGLLALGVLFVHFAGEASGWTIV